MNRADMEFESWDISRSSRKQKASSANMKPNHLTFHEKNPATRDKTTGEMVEF